MRLRVLSLLGLVLLIALTAFSGHAQAADFSVAETDDAEVPTPLTASASILENNRLIARIEGALDMPGEVFVEYRARLSTEVFRTKAVPSDGTDYVAHVTRLKPATVYLFNVFGMNEVGETSQGAGGFFVTLSLPPGLKKASYDVISGRPSQDITFMEFNDNDFSGIVAIDGDGDIVWYYEAEDSVRMGALAQKPNGNIVYIGEGVIGKGIFMSEITPLGEEVAHVDAECSPHGPWHHEVHLLSDNAVMFLSRDIQDPFGDPDRLQEGDTIEIWDQVSGDVTRVWNVFDFIDPTTDRTPSSDSTEGAMWKGCSGEEPTQDWTHGNSAMKAQDGSTLYSSRHLNQIVSIAPDFQSLNWRLGGPGSDFTFPDPNDRFYHQHSAVPLPNGNVLLFDNGNTRPAEEGGEYSRALELELDLDKMEARKVWEYRHTPDLVALCCSNTVRLDNGNTLMVFGADFGTPECCRTFTIVEADAQGTAKWIVEHSSPQKGLQYRVYPSNSIMGETRVSDIAPCKLEISPGYDDGNLTLGFDLGTLEPAIWSAWVLFEAEITPLWALPIPRPVDPPVSFELPPGPLGPTGRIGFLTALTTSEGVACFDGEILDTGAPSSATPSIEKLRELLPRASGAPRNN